MINRIVNSPITLHKKIRSTNCPQSNLDLTPLTNTLAPECNQTASAHGGWMVIQHFSNGSSQANAETILTWPNVDDQTKGLDQLRTEIYQQLDKFMESEKLGDNLFAVHFISAPGNTSFKFNGQIDVHLSTIWPKSLRTIHFTEGAQGFRRAIEARLGADCHLRPGFGCSTPFEPEVSSFALHKDGTFVEILEWRFSKLTAGRVPWKQLDTQGHAALGGALPSPPMLLHVPLKLKVYWQSSHNKFRAHETLARVYLWLEDPFGRTVHDLQRYPTVEVMCARPYGSSLQGTVCRKFDLSKDCVVFDDLSVSDIGEHMLFFIARDHSSTSVHRESSSIDPDMLTAHMAPFHLVSA